MKIELGLTAAEVMVLKRIAKVCGHSPRETATACLREWLLAEGRGRLTRASTYRDQPIFTPITEFPE